MFPFTPSQWQELEHQALVYKYMASGMPIPPDLLFTIRTSLESSITSKFLLHQPQHIGLGWTGFEVGFGRKIDPEPGRCRRTDGKKWRCSKEAYTDSKYCERHMHRGRNRSRKPVEIMETKKTAAAAAAAAAATTSSHENATNFFLEPSAYRNMQQEHRTKGYPFSSSEANSDSSWLFTPHGSSPSDEMKHKANPYSYGSLNQPEKVTHHFLDEWPPKDNDSWNNSEEKNSSQTTRLSISTPNSLHDFFVTRK